MNPGQLTSRKFTNSGKNLVQIQTEESLPVWSGLSHCESWGGAVDHCEDGGGIVTQSDGQVLLQALAIVHFHRDQSQSQEEQSGVALNN